MYEIIRSRMEQGGYAFEDAEKRVHYLVAAGQLDPDQAEELISIAKIKADLPSATDEKIMELAAQTEAISDTLAQTSAMLALIRPAAQQMAAETYDDTELVSSAALFEDWQADTSYKASTILRHNGKLYRVQQIHTSKSHQPPDATGMLAIYTPVQAPTSDGKVLPWVYGEAVSIGDKRSYEGKIYECYASAGANIWTPDIVPAIWRIV